MAVNVQNAHAKLVKAEFVGAVIRGEPFPSLMARHLLIRRDPDSQERKEPLAGGSRGHSPSGNAEHIQDRDVQIKSQECVIETRVGSSKLTSSVQSCRNRAQYLRSRCR